MGLFNSIGDFFNGDPNAGFDAANPYLEQAMAAIKQYMGPYHDIGMGVAPGLQNEYAKLMNDPAAMLEYFMGGYRGPLPQAEPNGMFSPAAAEGTWVMLKNPNGTDVKPVYVESRIIVSPFPLKTGN